MPKVSLFERVSVITNPTNIDLERYLEDTRDGRWEDIVSQVRVAKSKEERSAIKRTMPTCCLSGLFVQRSDNGIQTHSGYVNMDVDDLNEDLEKVKNQLKGDKYVYSVFMSTSGNGLRVLFRIKPEKHKRYFDSICSYLYSTYGIICEASASNVSKPFIVSYDPDLYINYNGVPIFDILIPEVKAVEILKVVYNPTDFEEIYNNIIRNRINICDSYEDWLKVAFSIAEQFEENGREYFHGISSISQKYNPKDTDRQYNQCLKAKGQKKVNVSSFYYVCKKNGVPIVSEKTKKIVKATKDGKRAGLSKTSILANLEKFEKITDAEEMVSKIFDDESIVDEDAEDIVSLMELFIAENYYLRFNEVSGYLENNNKPLSENDINSIFIKMKKVVQKSEYNTMIKLLRSDFVKSYNPFMEYFHSDGKPFVQNHKSGKSNYEYESPLIEQLALTIKNDDQAHTYYFLRKWIVSIISSMHGVHSPLLFCLLGKSHGTGKTEWFRRLLPDDLKQYYAESKLDKEKDDEILMTNYIVIMDDELAGKSKRDTEKLKSITSREFFYLRRPFGSQNEKLRRLAVLCGTSNRLDVLDTSDENRRIIAIKVSDIDKELYNSINKKDLFIEAYRLYKEGFDWRVNMDDQPYLNKDKVDFEIDNAESDLLSKYFERANDEEECILMTTTEILVEIEILTRVKCNIRVLGGILNRGGFIKKNARGKDGQSLKRWKVKKINRENPIYAQAVYNFDYKEDLFKKDNNTDEDKGFN